MNNRAQNQFTDSLAHVRETGPRETRELPGLAIWPILKIWLLILLFFISLLIWFPILVLTSDKNLQAQRRVLTSAVGVVLQAEKQPIVVTGNNTRIVGTTILKFSFRVAEGKTFYGSQTVSNDTAFALLKKGAPLPIVYDPRDPSFNGVSGVLGKNGFPVDFFLIVPLGALMYAAMIGWPLSKPLRQRMEARGIYKKGVLATGNVDFVKKQSGIRGNYPTPVMPSEVLFHFKDAAGQTHRICQSCDNDWLTQKLDVGSEVQVIYLTDRPQKCIYLEPFIA